MDLSILIAASQPRPTSFVDLEILGYPTEQTDLNDAQSFGTPVMDRPTFALVGAVNHGKSSIAATLVERGNIGVSADPGMTQVCQKIEHHSRSHRLHRLSRVSGPKRMMTLSFDGAASKKV